jgi:hypothetical protein
MRGLAQNLDAAHEHGTFDRGDDAVGERIGFGVLSFPAHPFHALKVGAGWPFLRRSTPVTECALIRLWEWRARMPMVDCWR